MTPLVVTPLTPGSATPGSVASGSATPGSATPAPGSATLKPVTASQDSRGAARQPSPIQVGPNSHACLIGGSLQLLPMLQSQCTAIGT